MIELNCPSGRISTHLNLADYGLVSSFRDSKHINNIYLTTCNTWAPFFYKLQSCRGKSECEIEFEHNWLKEECHTNEIYEERNLFIKYHCASKIVYLINLRFD